MASRKALCNQIRLFLEQLNLWTDSLEPDLPHKWETHGDCIIFPATTFQHPQWSDPKLGENLYELICNSMKIKKIARRTGGVIHGDCYRRPQVELLYGPNGWVNGKSENGVIYCFDVTKVMFSSGNISEKQRIASWDLSDQVVVDLYAGIGYFTLTYLIHCKAKLLYACEWNPAAIEALRINLKKNKIQENRYIVLEGDNTLVCPQNVADHVNLGLIPSSEPSWEVACAALKRSTGGILHVHGNVDLKCKKESNNNDDNEILSSENYEKHKFASRVPSPWLIWSIEVCKKIQKIIENLYKNEKWTVEILEVARVKSYGPNVDHLVVDVQCRPSTYTE